MALTELSFAAPDVALVAEINVNGSIRALAKSDPGEITIVDDSFLASSATYGTLSDALTAAQSIQADFEGTPLYGIIGLTETNVDSYYLEFTVGSPATINCEFSADAGTVTYQWSKDGTDIPDAEDSSISTGSFNANQAGTYTCTITATDTATARTAADIRSFVVTETPAPVVFNSTTAFGIAAVDSLTVNNAGTGYTADATGVTTTGGSGTGLTVDITTDGDAILTATVNFPGENYVDGETVTVSGDGNGDATLDITIN